jgi:rhodanese-related sulfurtransferase
MQSVVIAIALVALAVAGSYLVVRGRGEVAVAEARRLVEQGERLVDVRTPEEFARRHIPGAVNIPLQDLDRRMGELEPKDRPIVLYCRSGSRSARAQRMLKQAGYASVYDLGPMSRW